MLYDFIDWFDSIGLWGLLIIAASGFATGIFIFISVINYALS